MKAIFGLFAPRAIFHEFVVHFSWNFEFSLKKSRLIAGQEINFIFVFDALKMKISASTYFLEYWSYSNARQPRPRSSSTYQPRCHFLNLIVDTIMGRGSTKPTQFNSEMEQKTRQKLSQNIIGLYCSNYWTSYLFLPDLLLLLLSRNRYQIGQVSGSDIGNYS